MRARQIARKRLVTPATRADSAAKVARETAPEVNRSQSSSSVWTPGFLWHSPVDAGQDHAIGHGGPKKPPALESLYEQTRAVAVMPLLDRNRQLDLRTVYLKLCTSDGEHANTLPDDCLIRRAGPASLGNRCRSVKSSAATVVWPSPQDATYSPYGYSYPYVLYVPAKALGAEAFPFLIVKSNNPGVPGFNGNELLNKAIAEATATGLSLGHSLADRLGAPLLIPAFPRPNSQDHSTNLYTHSLSREAMLVASGPLYRIDLQLIAMTEEAKAKLRAAG